MGLLCRIVGLSKSSSRLRIQVEDLLTSVSDLIFSIPKLVSFLSQGTTLPAGTIVITGTPAGVGAMRDPKLTLKHGDEFAVEILPLIGTLVNKFADEK